jgi:hypothetical protein
MLASTDTRKREASIRPRSVSAGPATRPRGNGWLTLPGPYAPVAGHMNAALPTRPPTSSTKLTARTVSFAECCSLPPRSPSGTE